VNRPLGYGKNDSTFHTGSARTLFFLLNTLLQALAVCESPQRFAYSLDVDVLTPENHATTVVALEKLGIISMPADGEINIIGPSSRIT